MEKKLFETDPENVGTGLRAEIVLNIPSICLKGAFGEFDKIMEEE